MLNVRVIEENSLSSFQEKLQNVLNMIKENDLIEIKYSTSGIGVNNRITHCAIVIYK